MIRPAPRPSCLDDAYEWLDQGRAVVAVCPRADDVIVVSTKNTGPLSAAEREYLLHPEPLVRASFIIATIRTLREMMAA